jgi:hypothetical protein
MARLECFEEEPEARNADRWDRNSLTRSGRVASLREHIAISPHSGLYATPSLCGSAEVTRGFFRAFADHSYLACRRRGASLADDILIDKISPKSSIS